MILYSDLFVSMEDTVFFSILEMEILEDHPHGFFRTEFKKLKENFQSTSQDACCEIKLEYESMNMRNNEEPELFINTLDKLERRMNEDFNMNILDEVAGQTPQLTRLELALLATTVAVSASAPSVSGT